jgi:hypothetical protein
MPTAAIATTGWAGASARSTYSKHGAAAAPAGRRGSFQYVKPCSCARSMHHRRRSRATSTSRRSPRALGSRLAASPVSSTRSSRRVQNARDRARSIDPRDISTWEALIPRRRAGQAGSRAYCALLHVRRGKASPAARPWPRKHRLHAYVAKGGDGRAVLLRFTGSYCQRRATVSAPRPRRPDSRRREVRRACRTRAQACSARTAPRSSHVRLPELLRPRRGRRKQHQQAPADREPVQRDVQGLRPGRLHDDVR